MEVQPRLGRFSPLAEAQHDALFIRLNLVNCGQGPGEDGEFDDQAKSARAKAGQTEGVAEVGDEHLPKS